MRSELTVRSPIDRETPIIAWKGSFLLASVASAAGKHSPLFPQINDLNQVPVPVMLLPDDFKANSKIKVNNHLFNK